MYEERRRESIKILDDTEGKRREIEGLLGDIEGKLRDLDEEREELQKYQQLDKQAREGGRGGDCPLR